MRSLATIAVGLALPLAACGPKAITLPDDPIERAATCGVVAAAGARAGSKDIAAPLPFAAQGRIMHYALLAGVENGSFTKDRAAAVVDRMPKLEASITGNKWASLPPACAAAYPATARQAIELPKDARTSQLGCYMLADFLTTALRGQESKYKSDMERLDALERRLDARIGGTVKGLGFSAMQAARQKALATMIGLGTPMAVTDACVARYPG